MISISFPDGAIRQYEQGVSAMDIAKSISEGLARKVLVASVNNKVVDASLPITEDAAVKFLTWDDDAGKNTFWHSSAHLMAEAVESIFPGVKFWVGPALDKGFYYDIDLADKKITEDDLVAIEKKMVELAKKNSQYIRAQKAKAEAIAYFTEKGDEYKLDLLANLTDGEISFYTQGQFTDLCRGPHIPHTGFIKSIKLTSIAGAYWKGDEKNKMLTRIYGVTFPTQKEMDEYLLMLEEAKKRDHRKLGRELSIFTMDDDVGPGLPLWMPNGTVIIEELEKLAKETEEAAGYKRVVTPHIAKESMYLTSGHLPYYADSMFPPMELDGTKYYLKAMNCPHHHKIFGAEPKSYKDLPYRIAEYGTCYRYEQSGELFGLMRVRCLHMNDAHIYCNREQFAQEFKSVNDMYLKYFGIFGVDKYVMRLSLHDPAKLGQKYVNEPELWKETEDMVRKVLIETNTPFVEVQDEAAFYGPKIDVQIWSAIGKEFTLATNQVDFNSGRKFELAYTNQHNETEIPLIIHRAPLGTHERFIGFLLEHYAGKFPVWLAPLQAKILPISDKFMSYAQEVYKALKKAGVRVEIDDRSEKIGKKIRDTELMKVPYMLVIGEKEMNEGQLAIRRQGKGDMGTVALNSFIESIKEEILERKSGD
ncbi:MAG: threonine--tRNA ligase [Sphingobacteriia bacterium 24-36-13]|jgi:threonyl-tRNA synthetase|uniref:threonine--tRNA ligase n=1 Tax=Sediminibacterium sp. TaxID=1917865 RepID=UPI000BD808F9|nr:threonine--tRNA ligase [Sediminibacterium sp.]OYY09860.1 MAG: threonine--tRNA ligase [Sphingobacteriia bacterium 35-36-14]OYZ53554.1 MAG: threonine--tRNA ligase [Sphingobacteriia bacterium 24-36-13]OZA65793.1 MAG: threonine--tRNA ligase [Sphingobacteriia bacterium 39-36-14]HQS24738.1 threonine--tRNA ligase [Sediminibacterium sp.]HQS34378.1 threonine--tRNA ligase [Sediminibacterium sp.]